MPEECLISGTICTYTSCTLKNPLIGCRGAGEFLCFQQESCCNTEDLKKPFPIGLTEKTPPTIFGLSCYCQKLNIIKPRVCVAGQSTAFCFHSAAALPFDDAYVPKPICAIYGLRLLPGPVGCLQPTPEGFKPAGTAKAAAPAPAPPAGAAVGIER